MATTALTPDLQAVTPAAKVPLGPLLVVALVAVIVAVAGCAGTLLYLTHTGLVGDIAMTGITNAQTLFGNGVQATETNAPSASASKTTGGTDTASAAAASIDVTAGNVNVSSTAGALLSDAGDVRMDKVASLQAAIASGTYNVSSSDVANSLIASMLGE